MIRQSIALALSTVLLVGCSTTSADPDRDPPDGLAGSVWRLDALQSSDDAIGTVKADDPAKYEMRLGEDGSASFRLDCNRATGKWSSAGARQITFTPLAMTRAMCAPGSLDTRVAREIGYVRGYIMEGDRLVLTMMADGGSLIWTRAADE